MNCPEAVRHGFVQSFAGALGATRTGNLSAVVLLYFAILLSDRAVASESVSQFFSSCEHAFLRKEYLPLKTFIKGKAADFTVHECLRLNDHEFLATGDSDIRFIDTRSGRVEPAESGRTWENLEILSRFVGPSNKAFVLLKVSGLHHGIFGSGYSVFFLRPGKGTESYQFQFLDGDAFLDDDDNAYSTKVPSIDSCESVPDGRWVLDKPQGTDGPTVIEGNSKIRFLINQFDCKTASLTTIEATYKWDKKKFEWMRQEVIKQ